MPLIERCNGQSAFENAPRESRKRQSVLFLICVSLAGHFQKRFGHRMASVEIPSYVELTLSKADLGSKDPPFRLAYMLFRRYPLPIRRRSWHRYKGVAPTFGKAG